MLDLETSYYQANLYVPDLQLYEALKNKCLQVATAEPEQKGMPQHQDAGPDRKTKEEQSKQKRNRIKLIIKLEHAQSKSKKKKIKKIKKNLKKKTTWNLIPQT